MHSEVSLLGRAYAQASQEMPHRSLNSCARPSFQAMQINYTSPSDAMSNHYRLLMVEDSANDAELLLHALRDAPFTFSATRVETEADYLEKLSLEVPDVVLCDFHLPRFSADRALQVLNERHLDIPFIVVSHHIGEDAAVLAIQNGASDYLLKNRLGRLPNAIEAGIERRIARQQKALVEGALRTSESMKRGILNSLHTRIAVVDGNGVIVAINKAWEALGDTRGSVYKAAAMVGTNYVDLLKGAVNRGDKLAERELKNMLSIVDRESAFVSMEYELAGPGGTRWFAARAMALEDGTDGAVISHEDITDRMLAHHALADANKRLQAMSKRVLGIQEEERRRISGELHDDIGQSLSALKIGLHRLMQRTTERTNDDNKELLTECLGIADSTLDKLRNLSHELRPPQLDQLGLEDALGWLIERQRTTTGLSIDFQCRGLDMRLPTELESVCYRIAQEALNNATRHAKAKKISIRLTVNDRLVNLEIRDDGVGFDMDAARMKAIKTGSLGLISMEERAQLVGGRLKVRTVPGEGTTVQAAFVLGSPVSPDTKRSSIDRELEAP